MTLLNATDQAREDYKLIQEGRAMPADLLNDLEKIKDRKYQSTDGKRYTNLHDSDLDFLERLARFNNIVENTPAEEPLPYHVERQNYTESQIECVECGGKIYSGMFCDYNCENAYDDRTNNGETAAGYEQSDSWEDYRDGLGSKTDNDLRNRKYTAKKEKDHQARSLAQKRKWEDSKRAFNQTEKERQVDNKPTKITRSRK